MINVLRQAVTDTTQPPEVRSSIRTDVWNQAWPPLARRHRDYITTHLIPDGANAQSLESGERVWSNEPVTNQPITLAQFAGQWSIDRCLEDRLADRVGHYAGTALFIWKEDALSYSETGELKFPDQPALSARQEYLWRAVGPNVRVSFTDGRPFHEFVLSGSEATASHWCDPDRYSVLYRFSDWPEWTATWIVRGPWKDYVSVTRFKRTGDAEH